MPIGFMTFRKKIRFIQFTDDQILELPSGKKHLKIVSINFFLKNTPLTNLLDDIGQISGGLVNYLVESLLIHGFTNLSEFPYALAVRRLTDTTATCRPAYLLLSQKSVQMHEQVPVLSAARRGSVSS